MSSVAPAPGSFPPGTIFFHPIAKPGSNGETKFCRKVVVDVRDDSLICLPVTTNGGHATTKLDRARQSQHSIIYTGIKPPNPAWRERHLRKAAIQATIDKSPKVLNQLSRIDYGTEVVVECTDELSHLGRVNSVDTLDKEWKKVRRAQKAAAPEAESAQSHSSSALTGPEPESDAQERASQRAVARPDSPPPCVRAEQSVATLKPKEVMVKDGSSSNEASKPPRTARLRDAPERKSVSTSSAQDHNFSPDSSVAAGIFAEAVEAAVLRLMAATESSKQKTASVEEVIRQTGIHSQINSPYNVFQVKPMFNGPPPPYDVMDFEERCRTPISQRRAEEPGRTAGHSSSETPPPSIPPPAPMPPSSGMQSPEQDGYEESDATEDTSEDEPEYEEQPTNLHMAARRAQWQQALNTYLKPHQIGTGRGPPSSRAESSRSASQRQVKKRKDTLFLFLDCNRQQLSLEGRLDTGADCNFISPPAAREVAQSYHRYCGEPIEVANGAVHMPEWLIFTRWSIQNDDNIFWHDGFIVFNQLPCDVIIGEETIKKNDILRASPRYSGCFMLRFASSGGKKKKEEQEEERRRRQEHNRQMAAQQNSQTYQELEQEYANEMNGQRGYGGQNGP
ncbi:uncharacterized protein BKCO1_4300027 [Diplodia corticola]|uniref:DUF6590 domain-containing protein n=1 Tax=Diplodia corticola TaxID=236234 RepID=A0A1J9RU10_9PEZI|nr:uncharacterized protein BKCO1_4300027 [Diplodia corticola]OJD31911.1 hypothetical protein BKCO1_4300027 [Diplodia corticola]